MTVADIIASFGSAAEFSRALGLKRIEHGSTMLRRNRIPATYWPTIIRLSAERGNPVSLADLRSANPGASELIPVEKAVSSDASPEPCT